MGSLSDLLGPFCEHCGEELDWEDCDQCGGEGEFDAYELDPLWYDPGDTEQCAQCRGEGGWWVCCNGECPLRHGTDGPPR